MFFNGFLSALCQIWTPLLSCLVSFNCMPHLPKWHQPDPASATAPVNTLGDCGIMLPNFLGMQDLCHTKVVPLSLQSTPLFA